MSKYQVRFYTGEYYERQQKANAEKAVFYVEQHFNSAGPSANYSTAVVATNASKKSKDVAADYVNMVSEAFSIPKYKYGSLHAYPSLLYGGYNGRGNANLRHTYMPAILLEPLFISNPDHVKKLETNGVDTLALILANLIHKHFPKGGLIAFSVGHLGKRINTTDKGAKATNGKWEGDYAQAVMEKAKLLLEAE